MRRLIEGGEPFFLPGNEVGCLLLHGFTGTPAEMRPLGDQLAACGYTVLAPRLFGHATREEDLFRVRFQDWIASAEDGYHLLRPNSKWLIAIGLSGGGALALLLAAQFPLEAVVAMSTPYRLPPDPRLLFARPLSLVWRRVAKPHRTGNQDDEPAFLSYPHYPTWAIAEFNDLLSEMRRALPRVTAPCLLLQTESDHSAAVAADAIDEIHNSLGSRQKARIRLPGEAHVITRDGPREKTFEETTTFIQRVTGAQRDPGGMTGGGSR